MHIDAADVALRERVLKEGDVTKLPSLSVRFPLDMTKVFLLANHDR